MLQTTRKRASGRILLVTLGSICLALSFALFLEPCLIAPGGVSGIAMVINYLSGFPLGTTILALNAPLLLVAWWRFGARFISATLYATVLSSVLIDLGLLWLPPFTDDYLLASLYGGLLMGAGMGLVFAGGATTGGTDILGKLLQLRHPQVRLGRMILAVDAVIVALSAIVFRNINLALYAAITLYVSTVVIDAILYGSDPAVLTYIISDRHREIGAALGQSLQRGVTYLAGTGGHTGAQKQVILCVVRRGESVALQRLVEELDPGAFLVVTEAHQVFGLGFSAYKQQT